MRVLIMPEWYPDHDRPYAGAFCREQARAAARRHDVVVLTWTYDPQLDRRAPVRVEEIQDDVPTFRVRFRGSRIPKSPGALKLAGVTKVLVKLRLSGWKPDVIHAHEYGAGELALSLARVLRRPVVVTEHYGGFARGVVPASDLERARDVFERAAIVSPVSVDLERHLRKIAPRARFATVPNVVDDAVFRPSNAPSQRRDGRRLKLVAVGNLVDVKGHRYLLEALARFPPGRRPTLEIVGDGPLRDELVRLAGALGLDGVVQFVGPLSKVDVAGALRDSDVFVLPSLGENMPCALLEALACGVPAIATRVGGVPEVMDESRGVMVDPGSVDALVAAIEQVSSRLDMYDRADTSTSVRAGHGYDAIGSRWADVYAEALGVRDS